MANVSLEVPMAPHDTLANLPPVLNPFSVAPQMFGNI
jgi:hypothetical protein